MNDHPSYDYVIVSEWLSIMVRLDAVNGAEVDTEKGIGMSEPRHGAGMEAEQSLELPSSQRKSEEWAPHRATLT